MCITVNIKTVLNVSGCKQMFIDIYIAIWGVMFDGGYVCHAHCVPININTNSCCEGYVGGVILTDYKKQLIPY